MTPPRWFVLLTGVVVVMAASAVACVSLDLNPYVGMMVAGGSYVLIRTYQEARS